MAWDNLKKFCAKKNLKRDYFMVICVIHQVCLTLYTFILFLFFAAFHSNSFMEVFKAAYKKGSMARDSVAIRADQKSYSYDQLVSSALRISSLLCSNDLKTVSSNHLF